MASKEYYEAEVSDAVYGGAAKILEKERNHINTWRGRPPCAGIALSGGGIRSASFCLGALQALAYGNWLQKFDYLSTVSGGGYIGSSLSYLFHYSKSNGDPKTFDVSRDHFPYMSYPMVGKIPHDKRQAELKGSLLRNYPAPCHRDTSIYRPFSLNEQR